jgi:hypothetical protein
MHHGAPMGHDNSAENSPAVFIRGGEPWLMSYCWRTRQSRKLRLAYGFFEGSGPWKCPCRKVGLGGWKEVRQQYPNAFRDIPLHFSLSQLLKLVRHRGACLLKSSHQSTSRFYKAGEFQRPTGEGTSVYYYGRKTRETTGRPEAAGAKGVSRMPSSAGRGW